MAKKAQSKSKAKKPVKKVVPKKKVAAKKQIVSKAKARTGTVVAKKKVVAVKKVAAKPKAKLTKKVPSTKKVIAKKGPSKAAVKERVPAKEKVQKKSPKAEVSGSGLTAEVTKVPNAFGAYTLEQYKKYQELKKEWQTKTNKEIQEALKKNGQTKTGNKDELVNKVCDGIILGSIPRCPYCFGGRPKFSQQYGNYHCVGYRDDVDFKWCKKTMSFTDLPRTPWIE